MIKLYVKILKEYQIKQILFSSRDYDVQYSMHENLYMRQFSAYAPILKFTCLIIYEPEFEPIYAYKHKKIIALKGIRTLGGGKPVDF